MTTQCKTQAALVEGSCLGVEDVITYYDSKTDAILRRYGPGPRVHYHTGLFADSELPEGLCGTQLKRMIVASQECSLHYSAGTWNASHTIRGDILDVGCGLGGGSIFWAQEFGARVTAVTNIASHIPWVESFSRQAGVESQVRPPLCDATEVPRERCFDAAIAFDSSCHLRRSAWFECLAKALRPSARVFIADCFLGRDEFQVPFDRYWHTQIGTIDEYLSAATGVGFVVESLEDLSQAAVPFWIATQALIEAEARESSVGGDSQRRDESISAHSQLVDGLMCGGLRYALMSYSLTR
jgi:tocopherol O-methyltransferase